LSIKILQQQQQVETDNGQANGNTTSSRIRTRVNRELGATSGKQISSKKRDKQIQKMKDQMESGTDGSGSSTDDLEGFSLDEEDSDDQSIAAYSDDEDPLPEDVEELITTFFDLMERHMSNNKSSKEVIQHFFTELFKTSQVHVVGLKEFDADTIYEVTGWSDLKAWSSYENTPSVYIKTDDGSQKIQFKYIVPLEFQINTEVDFFLPKSLIDYNNSDVEKLDTIHDTIFHNPALFEIHKRYIANGKLKELKEEQTTEQSLRKMRRLEKLADTATVGSRYSADIAKHTATLADLLERLEAHQCKNEESGYTFDEDLHAEIDKLYEAVHRLDEQVSAERDAELNTASLMLEDSTNIKQNANDADILKCKANLANSSLAIGYTRPGKPDEPDEPNEPNDDL
jgi:hypothetical protein